MVGLAALSVLLAPASGVAACSSPVQAASSDRTQLAVAVDDGSVWFVSLSSGCVRLIVPCYSRTVEALAWSDDDRRLASIDGDRHVRVVDPTDGRVRADFDTSASAQSAAWRSRTVDFVSGSELLLLAGGASTVQLRSAVDGSLVTQFFLPSALTASRVSADRSHFAVGDLAGNFATYSARTGALESGPFRGPGAVEALAFDPDGSRLAVGSGDCRVRLVPLNEEGEARMLSHCDQDMWHDLAIGALDFSADGRFLLASSFPFWEVRLWNLGTGLVDFRYDYSGGNEGAAPVMFANGPRRIFAGVGGLLFDFESDRPLVDLGAIEPGTYRAAGNYAWTSNRSRLSVRDLRDGRLVSELALGTVETQ